MKMMRYLLLLLAAHGFAAGPAMKGLSLKDAESQALAVSSRLKAADQDVEAAREQKDAQWALLLPRLSLDASFRYVTVIPEISFGPGLPAKAFGDYKSWSVGPTLSYVLWDHGAARKLYQSLGSLAEAREEERKTVERQLLAAVRSAYVRAQLAREEFRLVQESLALSRRQLEDITRRLGAGAASQLDAVNAKREVSNYELRLAQGRADLFDAGRDLAAFLGETAPIETRDSLAQSADQADPAAVAAPDESLPQLQSQERMARSAELAADSQGAQRGPLIQLQARSSFDYPNGPTLERIQQNSVSASLSLPLFEWGRASSLAGQKRAEALAVRNRIDQTKVELQRDWDKAGSRIKNLQEERKSARQSSDLSAESARLTYEAYRAGRASYLDVQGVNLKAFEAQVQLARIEAQLLIQFHQLRSIAKGASL